MLRVLRGSKRVFLLEPQYRRKYVPLALAKIATYVKEYGGAVEYGRYYSGQPCDLVAMTSLFTTDAEDVAAAWDSVQFFAPDVPVLLGGIYASLMTKHAQERMPTAQIFQGYSPELDLRVPDYTMDWQVEDPWDQFSFTFTSRGCVNRCAYCAVHRLEPEHWVVPNWRQHIVADKPFAMISDNNLSAAPHEHLVDVVDYLADSGKRVVFDNGFDCKLITPAMAAQLARLRFTRHGMRMAFDRIEEDGTFQAAVRMLLDAGVPAGETMAYVLFNFQDTPKEADYRMRECVNLGIRPYPQRYQPLNKTDSTKFVGKHWTAPLVRAFRNFWLLAGMYQHQTFEEYMAAGNPHDRAAGEGLRAALGPVDMAAWEGQ